ncbi:MAG: hypothetical protein K6E40_15165 [Desulfovibrio sp.]|nr:hypothetical protein [Desulfovibrio sp.]
MTECKVGAETPLVSFALPTKNDTARRLEQLIVRMPPEGKAALARLAKAAGMPLSAYCRTILLNVVKQAGAQATGDAGQA